MSDLAIKRGDTTAFSILFTDSDGAAIDLTGYTVWFTVRKTKPLTSVTDDTAADIAKELTGQVTFPTGEVVVSLTASDTTIDYGKYFFDIQYKTPGGGIYSSSVGTCLVSSDITRSSS